MVKGKKTKKVKEESVDFFIDEGVIKDEREAYFGVGNKSKNETFELNNISNKKVVSAYKISTLLSVLWLISIITYFFSSTYNWNNLKMMMPHEFGGFMSGILVPVLFIWVIAFYIDKNTAMYKEKNNIYSFLTSVFNTDEKGKEFLSVIEKNLKTQIHQLKDELKNIEKVSSDIKNIYDKTLMSSKNFVENLEKESQVAQKLETVLNSKTEKNLKNTSVELDKISSTFESLTENATNSVETLKWQADALNNTVSDAVSASNGFALNLQGKQEEIQDVCEFLEKNTKSLEDMFSRNLEIFKQHKVDVEISYGDYKDTSEEMVDSFLSKTSELKEDLDSMTSNISFNTTELGDYSERFLSVVTTLNDKIENMKSVTTDEGEFVSETVGSLETNISHLSNVVEEFNDQISINQKEIEEKTDKIENVLSSQSSNINDVLDAMMDKTENMVGQIEDVSNELMEKTASSADRTADISGEMKDTVEHLENLFKKHNQAMENITVFLRAQEEKIEKSIKNQEKVISDSSEKIADRIDGSRISIKEYYEDVEKVSTDIKDNSKEVAKSMVAVSDVIAKRGDDFKDLIGKVAKEIDTVNTNIKVGIEGFTTTADTMKSTSDEVKDALAFNSDELVMQAEKASEYTRMIKSTIVQQAGELADISNVISSQTRLSEFSLAEQSQKLNSTFEGFVAGVADLDKKIAITYNNISKISSDMGGNFEKISGGMNDKTVVIANNISQNMVGVENVLKKMSEFTTGVKQAVDLSKGIKMPKDGLLKSVISKSPKITGSEFSEKASVIMEKLSSISVDVARLFDENISEDIWKAYYAGEKAVFAKYLAKNLRPNQIDNIKNLFKTDADFKGYMKEFITEYEAVLHLAESTERREIFLPIINSTDFGRVYMFLKGIS